MAEYKQSDYGDIFLDLCDGDLRRNVVGTLIAARTEEAPINQDQLNEIAAYINRLEDALVRHHTGELKTANVIEHLKACTGFDVSGIAFSVESMHAEDA